MFKKHYLATVIGLSCALSANADEFIQHDAHVHGQVELNLAQDGSDVLIEINAPGMDVLGFEHAPSNQKEKNLFNQSIETLEDAGSILTINPEAECSLVKAHAALAHHEHEHHDHEEHEHHDHDDAAHDEHEHEHEHAEHSAFDIEYQYSCKNAEQLSELNVNWFEQFTNTHKINANVFTDNVQASATLTPSNTKVKL